MKTFTLFLICALMLAPMVVAFNPQPEPPGKAQRYVSPYVKQGFNPQPEPPGRRAAAQKYVSPLTMKGFNPQPEPPGRWTRKIGSKLGERRLTNVNRVLGVTKTQQGKEPDATGQRTRRYVSPYAMKGFNPQPEPPGKAHGSAQSR